MKGVLLPQGFVALGKHIGVKQDALDFAVFASRVPCAAAAVFTKSRFAGPCIHIGRERLTNKRLQAVAVVSGIANVATGRQGLTDAYEMASGVADELGIEEELVLPSATGVIGWHLPMSKIRQGISGVAKALQKHQVEEAARAIMTTDTRPKVRMRRVGEVVITGVAKGAGMIEPNMATMLAFIMTDASLPQEKLEPMFRAAVDSSFNAISIDSDTSTSDTAVIMANGEAGPVDLESFESTLRELCLDLAKDIARDGEGATKLLEVHVQEARDASQAKKIAKLIVNSPLVKTAVHGADPNWGRVAAAIGKSEDATIDPDRVRIDFGGTTVFTDGRGISQDALEKVKAELVGAEVTITVSLGCGSHASTVWGCDLTRDYVHINASYTS